MSITDLQEIITSIGGNIISNAFYDGFKSIFTENSIPKKYLEDELNNLLHLHNVNVQGNLLITILAKNGYIKIEGSYIYSNTNIIMGSQGDGQFSFGNNSTSETKNTKIEAGYGAFIKGSGNAQIRQNEDGSISFHV